MALARTWPAVIAACLALASLPAAATAHVGVKRYSPAPNSTVARSLDAVRVTFRGRISDAQLTVTNSRGTTVSRARRLSGDKRRVSVRLEGGLSRGSYRARLKYLNTDGHVISKSWSFRLR
jgi:methionine-rich copper-binding protein CopC